MTDHDVVRTRKTYRGGRSARMHAVSAFRSLYNRAENDGLITGAQNAARRVAKPCRAPSTRQAIPDARLAEINEVIATTGNDPVLDSLLQRFHVETACRRGGALALRAQDLDPDRCLVMLREKGDTTRAQPVSPTLMRHLLAHAEPRGGAADPGGPLLRHRSGRPMSGSRYGYIWPRVGERLPWVAAHRAHAHLHPHPRTRPGPVPGPGRALHGPGHGRGGTGTPRRPPLVTLMPVRGSPGLLRRHPHMSKRAVGEPRRPTFRG